MITVIDRIKYLTEDKKAILDSNKILNEALKTRIKLIKRNLQTLSTGGKSVTVTITGTPKKGFNFELKPNSVAEQLVNKINKVIRK